MADEMEDSEDTLLEKALRAFVIRRSPKPFTKQDEELVEAWMKDVISLGQMAMALGYKNNSTRCYAYIAQVMRYKYNKERRK